MQANVDLRRALVEAAKQNMDTILPGYTHMQHAQPVFLAHHLLAYAWMFARDFKRLRRRAMPPTYARSARRRSRGPRTRSTAA